MCTLCGKKYSPSRSLHTACLYECLLCTCICATSEIVSKVQIGLHVGIYIAINSTNVATMWDTIVYDVGYCQFVDNIITI